MSQRNTTRRSTSFWWRNARCDRLALVAHRHRAACAAGRCGRRRAPARAGASGAAAGSARAARRPRAPLAAPRASSSAKSFVAEQLVGAPGRALPASASSSSTSAASAPRRWTCAARLVTPASCRARGRSGAAPRFFGGARSNQARKARSKISRSSRFATSVQASAAVDLVAHRQVDRVERPERVLQAARADLDAGLAQDPAERDELADDGVARRR